MADQPEQQRSSGILPPAFDIVALACSAGGLKALIRILEALPANFPASVVVVQHMVRTHHSLMASILARRTPLKVKEAVDGDFLVHGTVFLAPPNHHLLVNPDGSLSLSQSPLIHFVRPSADLLFESVAASYRERAIAVVLTGTGIDGALGLQSVKRMGGTTIVQDKATSEFFGMPKAAIQAGHVDMILPLEEIPRVLVRLLMKEA